MCGASHRKMGSTKKNFICSTISSMKELMESDVLVKTPDNTYHLGLTDEEISLIMRAHNVNIMRGVAGNEIYFVFDRGEGPEVIEIVDAFFRMEDQNRVLENFDTFSF